MLALMIAMLGCVVGLADNPEPPGKTLKLIFIHHSCGENWLSDGNAGLGFALHNNGYFVSDTSYGWGPVCEDCEDC